MGYVADETTGHGQGVDTGVERYETGERDEGRGELGDGELGMHGRETCEGAREETCGGVEVKGGGCGG